MERGLEIHHDTKKDAPSGTLLHLVKAMEQSAMRAHRRQLECAGRHPGTHEIGFDSAADTITLRMSSTARDLPEAL